jgi:hypothetical protein
MQFGLSENVFFVAFANFLTCEMSYYVPVRTIDSARAEKGERDYADVIAKPRPKVAKSAAFDAEESAPGSTGT